MVLVILLVAAVTAPEVRVSKTDLPNSWIVKPKKSAKSDAIRINDHFKDGKKPEKKFVAASRDVNDDDRSFLFSNLGNCPMKWMLSPEPVPSASASDLEPYRQRKI